MLGMSSDLTDVAAPPNLIKYTVQIKVNATTTQCVHLTKQKRRRLKLHVYIVPSMTYKHSLSPPYIFFTFLLTTVQDIGVPKCLIKDVHIHGHSDHHTK